jgi:hypothetical protein
MLYRDIFAYVLYDGVLAFLQRLKTYMTEFSEANQVKIIVVARFSVNSVG